MENTYIIKCLTNKNGSKHNTKLNIDDPNVETKTYRGYDLELTTTNLYWSHVNDVGETIRESLLFPNLISVIQESLINETPKPEIIHNSRPQKRTLI